MSKIIIFSAILIIVMLLIIVFWRNSEAEMSPTEDLMREHGILDRILLIYDEIVARLEQDKPFPPQVLHDSAAIVREFIEDYHEKNEEEFIFPKLQEKKKLENLVSILLDQHQVGRSLTAQILVLSKQPLSQETKPQLITLIKSFTEMYRAHESREDTEIFTKFRELVTSEELEKLGEIFEKSENELFGEDGYHRILKKVIELEKELGIHKLDIYTPNHK